MFNDYNPLFQELLRQHKAMIAHFKWDKQTNGYWTKMNRLAVELVLYASDFKCQYNGCKATEDLTIHHLVKRNAKEIMSRERYISARYYWNNMTVLCMKHHAMVDGHSEGWINTRMTLQSINRIRGEFAKAMEKLNDAPPPCAPFEEVKDELPSLQ